MSNVNGVQIEGAETGSPGEVQAYGADTNLNLLLVPKGTGDVYSTADCDFGGGYRQVIDGWYQDDVTASQSSVALGRVGDAVWAAFDGKWIAPRAGSITGVAVKSNDARTAGTLTVEVTKNGSGTGLTAVLDGTNTTFKATTQAKGSDTFAAGDELGVIITTDGSWAPTTADIRVCIEVEV